MRFALCLPVLVASITPGLGAQTKSAAPQSVPNPPHETPAAVAQYIKVPAATSVILRDVRVIDGTGAPAREHQDIVLHDGKIERVEPTRSSSVPASTVVLDFAGDTVFPG